MKTSIITATGCCLLAACQSLSPQEEQQYQNLMAQGAEPIEKKDPVLAAGLNVLPGIGDIYNGEFGAFVLDLLLWFPSIAWAVPQGAVTAGNINKKATIAYYTSGPGADQGYDADTPEGGKP